MAERCKSLSTRHHNVSFENSKGIIFSFVSILIVFDEGVIKNIYNMKYASYCKCSFPMTPYVRKIGWSLCHNFLMGSYTLEHLFSSL